MTIRRPVQIHCDWPSCSARHDSGWSRVEDARKDAKKAGYVTVLGLDFCGPADPEGFYPLFRPHNHAQEITEGEHRPVLVKLDTGYHRLRTDCTCGQEGQPASAREYAVRNWLNRHLAEVVKAARETARGGS